jgi:hypothetical protein
MVLGLFRVVVLVVLILASIQVSCGFSNTMPGNVSREQRRVATRQQKQDELAQQAADFVAKHEHEQKQKQDAQQDAAQVDHTSANGEGTPRRKHTSTVFDDSSEESALASGIQAVEHFYDDGNMLRSICACCNELFSPVHVRAVPVENGGKWHRRIQNRLSWHHTTFTCLDDMTARTKLLYSTAAPLLIGVPLAPGGVIEDDDHCKVRTLVQVQLMLFFHCLPRISSLRFFCALHASITWFEETRTH